MSLLTEGWPIFAGIGLVILITYGALRRHLTGQSAPRTSNEEDTDDR